MFARSVLRQVSLGLLSVVVLAACCQCAAAALITIEPDNYAPGTDLNTIEPGVTLGVYNSILDALEPPAISAVESTADLHTSTGGRVFALNGFASFSDVRQLDMTFAALADFVSIDFIGSSSVAPEFGILEIYDSVGSLLETYTTAGLGLDEVETMSLTRVAPDVKFARAYNSAGGLPFGRLDNLHFEKYTVIPEPMTLVLVAGVIVLACNIRSGTR